jgi:hypothetical protein
MSLALSVASTPVAATDFDLGLTKVVVGDRGTLRLADAPGASGVELLEAQIVLADEVGLEEDGPANMRLVAGRASWNAEEDAVSPEPEVVVSTDKKQGSWLRSHWYVPVVGAAVLYGVIDKSGDNIRGSVDCGCG